MEGEIADAEGLLIARGGEREKRGEVGVRGDEEESEEESETD